ncbi:MAG: YicC/YloC family endoribonuclease [Candidatus Omnitrophota bacterium]
MIKSMTGFGRTETRTKLGLFAVEIRTLNHKFLEITPKLPNSLVIFDDKVKNLVKNKIKRGKVYLNLIHESTEEASAHLYIDEKLAKSYVSKLKKLKRQLGIEDQIRLAEIISFPGVIDYKPGPKDTSRVWPLMREVVDEALKKLLRDREREGGFLFGDMTKRLRRIKRIVKDIKRSADSNVQTYKRRLKDRIKELSGGYAVDRGRLEVEVAIFAKNSDITEELTRLDNHIRNFTRAIKKSGEVGKKLDFIAQELHREINTVGSKSSGFNISKGVIEIKTEIEKIREQLKNIE